MTPSRLPEAPESRRRISQIRTFTALFIIGLILSGATAIPLDKELTWLARISGAEELVQNQGAAAPAWADWLIRVQSALQQVAMSKPFLFYGTDWLAFGHFVIAIAFIGALRDPVRNRWLFDFGIIACLLVLPYALVLGAVRGIPFWWRLIDCSFGVIGIVPLWLCRKWVSELVQQETLRR